ncbi:co-chaperone GroES [Gudongella sp. SC589]|jgi:chaperonin GroES|uniref:co-chaperone GroES n=1 Tax=Gudongella sp. SC589 TaxID=3385990 RepID=UPI0039049735
MNLKPLGDRIIIKKMEVEEKTKSGIVLPSTAKEQPLMAEIVAIGDEILNDEKRKDQVKVGDKVIFSKYAGTEVKVDAEELTILKLMDILAVVED